MNYFNGTWQSCDCLMIDAVPGKYTFYGIYSVSLENDCQIGSQCIADTSCWYTTLFNWTHYSDVIMSAMASQITGVSIACSTVCSGADQTKHQSSTSLAFVGEIHRWPVNSLHKGPVTRIMFPFDDVLMLKHLPIYHEMCKCSSLSQYHTL